MNTSPDPLRPPSKHAPTPASTPASTPAPAQENPVQGNIETQGAAAHSYGEILPKRALLRKPAAGSAHARGDVHRASDTVLLDRVNNERPRTGTQDATEMLTAYRLPTIILIVGVIMAIAGFQMALNHNMNQSRAVFKEYSDQLYRKIDSGLRRHELQMVAMGNIIGQIKGFSGLEFKDIADSFTVNSAFTDISLYTFSSDVPLKELYNNNDLNAFVSVRELGEIMSATLRADHLKQKYVSKSFQYKSDGVNLRAVLFVVPILDKYRENVFVVGVFDINKFLDEIFAGEKDGINVRVHQVEGFGDPSDGREGGGSGGTTPPARSLIYSRVSADQEAVIDALGDTHYSSLSLQHQRYFDDYSWDVQFFYSPDRMMSSVGLFPWITFLLILSISGLLGYLVFRMTAENARIRMLVKRQTKSLLAYNTQLERRNKDLDDFAYIASHDLKEPLRGIYNYAEFLIDDYKDILDDKGRMRLMALRKLSRRMEGLIETLLEYSKLSREDLDMQPVDLNLALEHGLAPLELFIREHNANIVTNGVLPVVMGHDKTLPEVFRNLVTNAIKYNRNKDKTITITAHPTGHDMVTVSVRDNGIGIPPEHQATVFKIFKRLHGRDEYGGGTGSGLTIVQKIIERHGGRIHVRSDGYEGTEFVFTLKAAPNQGV